MSLHWRRDSIFKATVIHRHNLATILVDVIIDLADVVLLSRREAHVSEDPRLVVPDFRASVFDPSSDAVRHRVRASFTKKLVADLSALAEVEVVLLDGVIRIHFLALSVRCGFLTETTISNSRRLVNFSLPRLDIH